MASLDQHPLPPGPPRFAGWIAARGPVPPDSVRAQHAATELLRYAAEPTATARTARNALEAVASATCALVTADRAAILIRADARWVLVTMWGDLSWPIGLRGADLLRALDRSVASSSSQPLTEHGREIGRLWVGRLLHHPFAPDECDALRTLADMTTLILHHQAVEAPHDQPLAESCTAVSRTVEAPLAVPSFPPALGHIVAVADGDAESAALRDSVALDPALAAKAIQIASSPALGRAHVVRSLDEALVVLGQRGVRNLAIAQFGRALFARWTAVDRLLWEHALGTAVAMQALLERREPAAAEDGFLCGLLHDVGRIALQNARPGRYERLLPEAAGGTTPWDRLEVDAFGTSALAALPGLIDDWVLPPRVASTLHEMARGSHPPTPLHTAFAWAAPTALRLSPGWRHQVGGRPEPAWLLDAVARGADTAHLPADEQRELDGVVATRCDALRRLLN